MLTIQVKQNPFKPASETVIEYAGKTLLECLEPYMDGGNFSYPTVVCVDSLPWLRKDWGLVVPDNSKVTVIGVVGDPGTAFLVFEAVVLVATAAFTAYGIYKARKAMRALRAGSGQADSAPFFTVEGHSNRVNLNSPIEVAYGKNRMWPSYIARPYRTYVDDRASSRYSYPRRGKTTQYVQIFCIGQGSFTIHAVQLGDVLLESYSGLSYEVIQPGDVIKDITKITYVQPDFEEKSLNADETTDIFYMSPAGATAKRFEIDVEFPADANYTLSVVQKEVDITTGATTATSPITTTFERPRPSATEVEDPPHRHTFSFYAGSDNKRYAIQITNTSATALTILELRSFLDPNIPVGYDDKTLLVVKYDVNSFTAQNATKDKINVIATRRLNTIQKTIAYGSTATVAVRADIVQATRSIPWAFYDVLTNKVYGGGLAEEFIDIEGLAALHSELEKEGVYFDYVFNQNSTTLDVAKVIAAAGRCSIGYNGSRLTLHRDIGNSIPEAIFTPENIIPNSFSWTAELFDPTEPDAIEVAYVDSDSGEERTTLFIPEDSEGNNIQKLTLQGVSSHTVAWREAAHKQFKLQYCRDTFSFKTGLEGYIPSIGATALLSWDMEGLGISGYILDYANGWLKLSRPILPDVAGPTPYVYGRVVLRRDDGSVLGPFDVTDVADSLVGGRLYNWYKSIYVGEIDFNLDFSRVDREPVYFSFGADSTRIPSVAKKIQITSAVPDADGTITIKAINYDDRVYAFDDREPPTDETEPTPAPTPALAVSNLRAVAAPSPMTDEGVPYTQLRWKGSYGAAYYQVHINSPEEELNAPVWVGRETSALVPIPLGIDNTVNVIAYNSSGTRGTSAFIYVSVGYDATTMRPSVGTAIAEVHSDRVKVRWDNMPGADRYEIRFWAITEGGFSIPTPSAWYTSYAPMVEYTKTMFKHDFGTLTHSTSTMYCFAQVRAVIDGVTSAPSTVEFYLPQALAPTDVVLLQDPEKETSTPNQWMQHKTITWSTALNAEGTTYRIHVTGYIDGTDGYGDPRPVPSLAEVLDYRYLVAETDKGLFTTESAPRILLTDIDTPDGSVIPTSVTFQADPLYGPGCLATLKTATDFSLLAAEVGLRMDGFLYLVSTLDASHANYHESRFYSMIKKGTTDNDAIWWVAGVTASELSNSVGYMLSPLNYQLVMPGDNTRHVKVGVIADNGWYAPKNSISAVSIDVSLD